MKTPGSPNCGRAADEELHRQQGLAAAGAAADERGPAARQAAAGDLVEPLNAGRGLGECPFLHGLVTGCSSHPRLSEERAFHSPRRLCPGCWTAHQQARVGRSSAFESKL